MTTKLIKKQYGGRLTTSSSIYPQLQPSNNSSENSWDNVNNLFSQAVTNLGKTSTKFNMTSKFDIPKGPITALKAPPIEGISVPKLNLDDIGKNISTTVSKSIATNTSDVANAAKLASASNFASGMGVVSQLADPVLQMGEGVATSLGATFASKDKQSSLTDTVSSGLGMLGPWGMAAGVGLKAFDLLDRGLGKNVKAFQGNTGTSAYTDFSTAGNKFRMTQSGKAKKLEQSKLNNQKLFSVASDVVAQQNKFKNASGEMSQNTEVTTQNQLNNFDPSKILLSKKGSKLDLLKEKVKSKKTNEVKVAQHGSVVDGQETLGKEGMTINIIPDGALHARKHHMEDTNDEMTKKGIPVISIAEKGDILDYEKDNKTPKTIAEGGEVIQHAEIEKEEVILHLGLTKQLEKLMKDNTIESTIEAGRLLAKELMENTQDNTSLTEKLIRNEN